jgi:hypothetical protein
VLLTAESIKLGSPSRATRWAAHLLALLGARTDVESAASRPGNGQTLAEEWAASGLLGLGSPERPVATLVSEVDVPAAASGAAMAIQALSGRLSARLDPERAGARPRAVALDAGAVLTERAVIAGLVSRAGRSAGESSRILPSADGWIAFGLRRVEDFELVPALIGRAAAEGWSDVSEWVSGRSSAEVVERAAMLGLSAAAIVGEPVTAPWRISPAGTLRHATRPLVVDLSSLWAGPLAGSVLADAGARVVKLELTNRPDGARRGPADFYDLLNAGKASVAVELGDPMISRLLEAATVVITSARPRALRQLGWLPRPGQTWITITGYGWDGTDQDRVGYGDEAAFAAGLIAGLPERPEYLADAIADPLTGMHAAVAALASLVSGVAAHVDVSLYSVCAHLGTALRGDRPRPTAELFSAPRRRPSRGRAAELGADNADVAGLL